MRKVIVSVITPAYNSSSTLKDTYRSIQDQTFKEWEWIVVNDNSQDDTASIIKEIAASDPRVVLINLSVNGGAAKARNLAIEAAKGKFIAFLDSDDLWLPTKLEKQLKFMTTNNYDFTYGDYYVLFPNGKRKVFKCRKNSVTYKNLLKSNTIGCLTAMYNASSLGKMFMPIDAPKREDHAAWLDLLKKTKKAYHLNDMLGIYRVGEHGVSSNKLRMMKYQYILFRRHEKFNFAKSLWYTFLVSLKKFFTKYH